MTGYLHLRDDDALQAVLITELRELGYGSEPDHQVYAADSLLIVLRGLSVEPTEGEQRIEYAVRFDAPATFAGRVGNIRDTFTVASRMARQEEDRANNSGVQCTVVQRTVTCSPWVESDSVAAPVPVQEDHQ